MLVILISFATARDIPASGRTYDIVVAPDGSGDFKTVQEAFNAVPDHAAYRTTIFIKNGRYKEKLVLPPEKTGVTVIGENRDSVILTYDDHSGKRAGPDTLDTWTSCSTWIRADGFVAGNVTFENAAGRVGQAVAIRIDGDRIVFRKCRLIGNQDTFFTYGMGRCYLDSCYIEGTTDFIFGASIAVFDHCTLHSKKKSHVTAASTPQGNSFGYVFRYCTLTADSGLRGVSLGRPWRPYARVVYLSCTLGAHIDSAGWNNWKNPANEKTAFYAEYQSRGSGAVTVGRVAWSRQLTGEEAAVYTLENIFAARSAAKPYSADWDPRKE